MNRRVNKVTSINTCTNVFQESEENSILLWNKAQIIQN